MPYQIYNKPYCSPQDLITHLENHGLTVGNRPEAEKFLSDINYYRFKIYLRPYLNLANNQFHAGATFQNGIELYRFDDELRDILFSLIGRIEIKLRSKLDQVVTSHTQNPFWYLDDSLFANKPKINGLRATVSSLFQNSRDDFSNHFKQNYYNDINPNFKHLPPFWMAGELTTFGNVVNLYSAIDKAPFAGPQNSNKLDDLAREFGARNLRELNNWISLIKDVRNRCAHHSRVWNANLREPSNVTNQLSINPAHPNRLYQFIALVHKISSTIDMNINIKDMMLTLFAKYPAAVSKENSAGFPNNWQTDPYWN